MSAEETSSDLLGSMAGVQDVAAAFSHQSRVLAMLVVEVALAEAETSLGIIPPSAAAAIREAARPERFDPAELMAGASRSGNLAIPLVGRLTSLVASANADAARYVHWGATSQDVIDTALVIQLRAAVGIVLSDLDRAADAAAGHALAHAGTPMACRTWLQQATPITFGLKVAGWLDSLVRARRALAASLDEALVIQFGGASGTLAALGPDGPAVAERLAEKLGLNAPPLPWHAHRGRLARLAADLGIAAGTLGKIARDLGLLAQTEIAEAFDPPGEAGGSSTMPHKRNPVRAAIALTAAARAPGLVATILGSMVQEHERGLGGWQAEWDTLPELVIVAAAGARSTASALAALVVDANRMRANLDASGGLAMAEAIAMRLAAEIGRADAHAIVEAASRRAVEERRPFAAVLSEDHAVTRVLGPSQIEHTLAPEHYLGATQAFIDAALTEYERSRRTATGSKPAGRDSRGDRRSDS